MIEAIEIKCNHWVVRATDPNTGKEWQSLRAFSEPEAVRVAHFMNRRYIVDTMCSWLRQRMKAYQVEGFEQQAALAGRIIGQLLQISQASVSAIQKFIQEKEKAIHSIAPGEKSSHYPYYEKVIRSIMAFCNETEAAHA